MENVIWAVPDSAKFQPWGWTQIRSIRCAWAGFGLFAVNPNEAHQRVHWLKRIFVDFPLLVVKGVWKYVNCCPGGSSKWKEGSTIHSQYRAALAGLNRFGCFCKRRAIVKDWMGVKKVIPNSRYFSLSL